MKKILKQLLKSTKGAIDITGVVIDVVLVVSLIPVIVTFIASASAYVCNSGYTLNGSSCYLTANQSIIISAVRGISTTESTLLGLTTLFIVLALVFMIVKQSGLIKGKN